jgi:hypothetical protein
MPVICTFRYVQINRTWYQAKVKNRLCWIFEKLSSRKVSKITWLSIEFYNFQRVHRIAERGQQNSSRKSTIRTENSNASQELKQERQEYQHLYKVHRTKDQIRIPSLISQLVVTVARTWWETFLRCWTTTNRMWLTLNLFKLVFLNRIIEVQKLSANLRRKMLKTVIRSWYLLIHNKFKNHLKLIKTYLKYK